MPITAYTKPVVVATLPNSYNKGNGDGDCYYWFDFDNNRLVLFGVPTVLGETLYMASIAARLHIKPLPLRVQSSISLE